jgi:hypothetical protein
MEVYMSFQDLLLVPRNLLALIVGIVARISGCPNQKELSLDDQVDHAKEIAGRMYSGPVEYRIIATKGKGERLDRPELEEIQRELLKGELDLLIMEDMGRLVRGPEAIRLFGMGVDHGIRCISPNDRVDTINPTWEEDALAACRDHVSHNSQTSLRLKQKLMNRFQKFGGATARPIASYVVPPDAKTYSDWRKDDEATPIIKRCAEILLETLNGEAGADYFNNVPYKGGIGFPVGPYCDQESWNGRLLLSFFRNTLLSGRPQRGKFHSIKQYETGRRFSVRNPAGPITRNEPHLAHLDPDEHDELIALLKKANANFKRKGHDESDPRWRVRKKDTRWPGQSGGVCWYCGRHIVWGGNGVTANLMCSAAREGKCWNSVGFNGELATKHVIAAIMAEVEQLPEIDVQLRDLVQHADEIAGSKLDVTGAKIRRDERELDELGRRLKDALKAYGHHEVVDQLMADFNARELQLRLDRKKLAQRQESTLNLPSGSAELQALFREEFGGAAAGSREFARLLRRLVPAFHFYLVRSCTVGPPLPRLRFQIQLDGVIRDADRVEGLSGLLTRYVTVDVFEPSPREEIRDQAVGLARAGNCLGDVVRQISTARGRAVAPRTVKGAIALQEEMERLNVSSPYVLLREPPPDYHKLRRHRSSKYRFEPKENYVPPVIDE